MKKHAGKVFHYGILIFIFGLMIFGMQYIVKGFVYGSNYDSLAAPLKDGIGIMQNISSLALVIGALLLALGVFLFTRKESQ